MSGLNGWMEKAMKETPFHDPKDEHAQAQHDAADRSAGAMLMDKGGDAIEAMTAKMKENAQKVKDAQDPKKPGAEKPDLGAPGKGKGGHMSKMKPGDHGAEHSFGKGSDKPEEQKDVEADPGEADNTDDASMQETNDEVEKGLGQWLSKAIPGASDEGEGKPAPMPSGIQNGLDERKGNGPAEVARGEDGGKLAGKGTTSGKSDDGAKNMQTTTKAASPGSTDQLTPDDPNDTDKMKDELGMIEIPGAPMSAYGSMQAQTSAAGRAYGPATKPMTGMGGGGAANGSSPTVGKMDLGHKRTQGGVGTAAEVKAAPGAPMAGGNLSEGGAQAGAGGGARSASSPAVGAPGLHHDKSSSKLHKGPTLDGDRTGVIPLEDPTVRDTRRRNAAAQANIRKGEENIQGFGLPALEQPQVTPQGARPVQVMAKGGAIYSNADDEACMAVLEKGDFYHGTQPGFDLGNSFQKSESCGNCGTAFQKALSTCPECGTDRNYGFQKSVSEREGGRLQDVRQTHSHGPGLRRANNNPDFHAPDGLVIPD